MDKITLENRNHMHHPDARALVAFYNIFLPAFNATGHPYFTPIKHE